MKSITVDVPRDGAWVELVPRAGSSSGQVVVVLTDDVEMRLAQPAPSLTVGSAASPPPTANNQRHLASNAKKSDLNYVLTRLLKLKPTTRKTAANSIKAMFQFQSPMSDQEANRTLDDLCKRRLLTIDADDRVSYPTG